jgi:saccharopine dehydrogenase-like NADP-dependent oxidoreductase
VVEVLGEKDGKRTKVKLWTMMSHKDAYALCGTNAGAYLVGTGGAVATDILVDGEVGKKGIVIPEELDVQSFLRRLKDKAVTISEEVSHPD